MSETKDLVEDNRHTAAAKARPRAWSELVGQPRAVEVLTRILQGRRETTGYLLSGPTGTGKTSAAYLLGLAMSCEHRDQNDVDCCPGCRKRLKSVDPRRAQVLSFSIFTCSDSDIDDRVKGLVERGDLSEGRGHVFLSPIVVLLDEAQELPRKTQRRLLSELDSPDAEGGVLLLATNEPEALMPALRDRCTEAPFFALGPNALRAIAERYCESFGYKLDDQTLSEIVLESDESGRSMTKLLRERALYSARGSRMPLIADLIDGIVSEDLVTTSAVLDRLQERGQFEAGLILKSISTVWHGALVQNLGGRDPGHFYGRFRDLQSRLSARNGERLQRELSLIAEVTRRDAGNTRTRLAIDALIAELMFRVDLDTKLARIERKLSELAAVS